MIPPHTGNKDSLDINGAMNGGFNMRGIMDLYITNQMMGMLSNITKADSLNVSMIISIIFLISITEIKNNLGYLFEMIKKHSKEFCLKIWTNFVDRWNHMKKKEIKILCESEIKTHMKKQKINIKQNLNMVRAMFEYIYINPDTCQTTKDNELGLEYENLKENITSQRFKNISIMLDDMRITLEENIIINTRRTKTETKIIGFSISDNKDKDKIKSLTELIDDEAFKTVFNECYNCASRIPEKGVDGEIIDIMYSHSILGLATMAKNLPTQKFIMRNFKNNFKGIPDSKFYNEIFLMLSFYEVYKEKGGNTIYQTYGDNYCAVVFGFKIWFPKKDYSIKAFSCGRTLDPKYFQEVTKDISNRIFSQDNDDSNKNFINESLELHFILTSTSSEFTLDQMSNKFMDWIEMIYDNTNNEIKNTVKMNYLSMERKEVINEKDNPAYEEYMEFKKNLSNKNSTTNKDNDSSDRLLMEFMKMGIPPQKIKEVKTLRVIKNQEVSKMSKKFSTLYLREKDRFDLEHVLDSFYSKRELFEDLGLQHKLGVLLYGLPGTGKSSTISAIGTYLKKDLYYVNLINIETNEELQMIFDYVNKNCVNGGIIIFEDIDAMTKIVHKRKKDPESRDLTLTEIVGSKKDKLTLEYFLNLLQGSLTQSGTIYIMTTNHIDVLDPALYREGRFDVKIEMKLCDRFQINCIYKNFFKRNIPEDILNGIQEDKWTPAAIIYHIKKYMFSPYSDKEILAPFIE